MQCNADGRDGSLTFYLIPHTEHDVQYKAFLLGWITMCRAEGAEGRGGRGGEAPEREMIRHKTSIINMHAQGKANGKGKTEKKQI